MGWGGCHARLGRYGRPINLSLICSGGHLGRLASGIDWRIDLRDCADRTAACGVPGPAPNHGLFMARSDPRSTDEPLTCGFAPPIGLEPITLRLSGRA
jgi:hypothetical protein